MLDLMVFHVLVVLVVIELHADFIVALTPAVPVRTVWLMAVQLWLYACSTPVTIYLPLDLWQPAIGMGHLVA